MAETNEVVTFGDLYAMTSFLSNAEFIHSNYFSDKTKYTVQCLYEFYAELLLNSTRYWIFLQNHRQKVRRRILLFHLSEEHGLARQNNRRVVQSCFHR